MRLSKNHVAANLDRLHTIFLLGIFIVVMKRKSVQPNSFTKFFGFLPHRLRLRFRFFRRRGDIAKVIIRNTCIIPEKGKSITGEQ